MDDLEFRRRAYAEPNCQDDDFLEKISLSKDNQKLISELQLLDQQLKDAMNIDVSEGLSKRILLNQTLEQHSKHNRRVKLFFSMAASVLIIFSLVFTFLSSFKLNIEQEVLAHIYEELDHLNEQQTNDVQRVNYFLSSIGGTLTHEIGKVNYLGSCDIANKEGVHMVLAGDKGPVTVMMLPHVNIVKPQNISDQRFSGSVFPTAKGSIAVIGENGEHLDEIKRKLKNGIRWI